MAQTPWWSAGSVPLWPSTTASERCHWLETPVQPPVSALSQIALCLLSSADGCITSRSRPPRAAAARRTVPRRPFILVIAIRIITKRFTKNVTPDASNAELRPPKAPCPPQGLTAVSHCGTDSLLATWTASPGATSYTTTVTGPGGFSQACSSSPSPTCSVSGLQCASQYEVRVTSQDSHCSSPPAETFVTTGCLLIYGSILFIHIISVQPKTRASNSLLSALKVK